MSQETNTGVSPTSGPATPDMQPHRKDGVGTHVLLVLAMSLVTVTVTALCLLLIRHRLRAQVTDDLSQDLHHSVTTFHNLEAERMAALERENALLAELPTLKALMTSGDDLTIQDGAVEFWQLSGDDLFVLADATGRVVAVYRKGNAPDTRLREALATLVKSPEKHYLLDGGSLYACSLRPLYFGGSDNGTLLGYVVSGISIERTVREISEPSGADAAFLADGQIVASTLDSAQQASLLASLSSLSTNSASPSTVQLGGARYLAASENLSLSATSQLRLAVLESYEPAERWINRIDRIVLSTGLLALLFGTALMIVLSHLLTRPLEELSKSVRAFGMGDAQYSLPRYGTQEVRQLSAAFDGMRKEIQQANRALLESERLATIGLMASSVSHDLRHYLAAVYANAEFLASDKLPPNERAEIFADIRAAVHGTTDMIESLLIFSRTGSSIKRSPELMSTILDGAVALIRVHPDAEGVDLITHSDEAAKTAATVDGKQIERAIYNLLLNACQAVKDAGLPGSVVVTLSMNKNDAILNVTDSGSGVPAAIRGRLFEPFVSEGKQKGTGLGLTLAHCIAAEHGGGVVLVESGPGRTTFQMRVARELKLDSAVDIPYEKSQDQVVAHEKAWT